MADININYNYSFADIERYVSGSMTAKEMHDIERTALQDPFLADAIEGYQNADKKTTETHLNEIAAALQVNKAETKIIALPKQKNYGWQIAASVIIIIGAGVLFFTKQSNEKTSAPLASNVIKNEEKKDLSARDKNAETMPLKQDSLSSVLQNLEVISKKKNTDKFKNSVAEKKEKPADDAVVLAAPSKQVETTMKASSRAASGAFNDKAITTQQQPPMPQQPDTLGSLSEVVVTSAKSSKAKPAANMWTTDKGKPFHLSEIETINIGRTGKKTVDTSVIKPEGGWQLFHNYLFSRLSKKDTANFANTMHLSDNLELEFSLGKEGSPYNIAVLHAQDSTTVNEVISAIQQGPKWLGNTKKDKRLNLKY